MSYRKNTKRTGASQAAGKSGNTRRSGTARNTDSSVRTSKKRSLENRLNNGQSGREHLNQRRAKRRRRKKRRKNQKAPLRKKLILAVAAVIVLAAAAYAFGQLHLYITESDVTSENPYPVKGVDVSSYQLDIDWKGLESEGYKFAYIKATEGSSHVDERFGENWEEVNQTGIKAGAYHFLSYDTSGRKQAVNFMKTVKKKHGMLPPAVDVEFYGEYEKNHPSEKKLRKILDAVLEELEANYGQKPVIYTNSYIYTKYISGKYDDYPIWISSDDILSELPDGRSWTFCQYTFYGKSDSVAGGEKYVDLNVFNGSSWDLRKGNWK